MTEERTNDGTDRKPIDVKAHSIAEGIRAGKGGLRDMFRRSIQAKIDEQRKLHESKVATCMPNPRIQGEKPDANKRKVCDKNLKRESNVNDHGVRDERQQMHASSSSTSRQTTTSAAIHRLLSAGKSYNPTRGM